jgi:hypothetical protein
LEKKIHEKRSRHKVTEMVPLEKKIRKGKNKTCWWKKSEENHK